MYFGTWLLKGTGSPGYLQTLKCHYALLLLLSIEKANGDSRLRSWEMWFRKTFKNGNKIELFFRNYTFRTEVSTTSQRHSANPAGKDYAPTIITNHHSWTRPLNLWYVMLLLVQSQRHRGRATASVCVPRYVYVVAGIRDRSFGLSWDLVPALREKSAKLYEINNQTEWKKNHREANDKHTFSLSFSK